MIFIKEKISYSNFHEILICLIDSFVKIFRINREIIAAIYPDAFKKGGNISGKIKTILY